jgi:signal transduction histidine kinase
MPTSAAAVGFATRVEPRIAWRRRMLLVVAGLGCLAIFIVARFMAQSPALNAEWRVTPQGKLQLVGTREPALEGLVDSELSGVVSPAGPTLPFEALSRVHSTRWINNDALRHQLIAQRLALAQSMATGRVQLVFDGDSVAQVKPHPRGYVALGAMFWLMSAFAMVLFLVGWIVPLVRPDTRNILYGVMAQAQAVQLVLIAVESVPAMVMPEWVVLHESPLQALLDAVTGAAIIHAAALHPVRLRHSRWIAGAAWSCAALLGCQALWLAVPGQYWLEHGYLLACGLATLTLMDWSYRSEPHPFLIIMRRFGVVTLLTLALLTMTVAYSAGMAPDVRATAAVGPVIWTVFLASLILLVPFLSRSQQIMREFAMLAGISTVATAVDLLFVAVFSFSQFASLTFSLFIALGVYAAARQWLLNQVMGARALTTERVFDHLYRIAREVEARPERATERMIQFLGNVFEPLETTYQAGNAVSTRVVGSGSTMLVPVPNLVEGVRRGIVVLRFAERGKRLFMPEDARLADRINEQLMRALAHDRAVERGRSEERTRIAQDLHDDIGARLLTLMYKSPNAEMEDYVRHTLQDLKTLTRGLAAASHPLSHAAGEWKADIAQRLAVAHCELEWQAQFDSDLNLNMVQWSSLTRILRELVSNALSHAQAHQVQVDLRLNQGLFRLTVQDDGSGRSPETWAHGLGLGGIRKRVKSMGGEVHWTEAEPKGIACAVVIPNLSRQE